MGGGSSCGFLEGGVVAEKAAAGAVAVQDATEMLAGDTELAGGFRNRADGGSGVFGLYRLAFFTYFFVHVTCHREDITRNFSKRQQVSENILKAVVELMQPKELVQRLAEYVQGLGAADIGQTVVLVKAIHECAEELRRKRERTTETLRTEK